MTRINLLLVEELTDQHLLAEHREIKRVPNVIASGKWNLSNQPSKFTLGEGHVKFFYDKLEFLYCRYLSIHYECKARGFNVENYEKSFIELLSLTALWNDYEPTDEAISLSKNRIREKIESKSGFYRMRGVLI